MDKSEWLNNNKIKNNRKEHMWFGACTLFFIPILEKLKQSKVKSVPTVLADLDGVNIPLGTPRALNGSSLPVLCPSRQIESSIRMQRKGGRRTLRLEVDTGQRGGRGRRQD